MSADQSSADQSSSNAVEPTWVGDVLDFWFQETAPGCWFVKSAELDGEIRTRFLALHERILAGGIDDLGSPRAVLAAVVVLDQFSRNMFRDTPRAFATDPVARRLARRAVEQGLDAGLTSEQRVFLYLPFEHSEDRGDQAFASTLIGSLGNDDWTRYAEAHKAIIDRFGRFPHRNAVLGRDSTPEELQLLRDPMASF